VQIVTSVAAMQRLARQWQQASKRMGLRLKEATTPQASGTVRRKMATTPQVGFVPTMGYLHAGHMSLVRVARQQVGKAGKVVVSIYVNPTQFGPKEDFSRYPRDLKRDLKLCREAGVDVVFAPSDREMYPRWGESLSSPKIKTAKSLGSTESRPTEFSSYVVEANLSKAMEGASRPTHFRGVTTVVAKLFNIVLPDVAVFGAKDWQQATIIKRMVRDLNFPVRIIVAPTLRERDGLAMSSRNKYLIGDLRRQATVLWCSIQMARATVKKLRAFPAPKLKAAVKRLVECEPAAKLDYVEFFEPDMLLPVSKVTRGTHMALAVFVGKTRLIDNARL
jgi:pantoate--beta-alanine ligase